MRCRVATRAARRTAGRARISSFPHRVQSPGAISQRHTTRGARAEAGATPPRCGRAPPALDTGLDAPPSVWRRALRAPPSPHPRSSSNGAMARGRVEEPRASRGICPEILKIPPYVPLVDAPDQQIRRTDERIATPKTPQSLLIAAPSRALAALGHPQPPPAAPSRPGHAADAHSAATIGHRSVTVTTAGAGEDQTKEKKIRYTEHWHEIWDFITT